MQEKENVLRILEETREAIKKEDSIKLKELSDHTIHTASTSQDPENISIAVIVYSISKIIEREKYREYSGWKEFYKTILSLTDNLIKDLQKNDDKKLSQDLGLIQKSINKLSGDFKKNIQDVFRKASINKASRIYEHGISMEKTASLLGITMFELASYAGQTGISDVPISKTMEVKARIKTAMEMFG